MNKRQKFVKALGEFIAYSIVALFMLALVVGGFFAHLALIRWGLRIWPI